MKKQLQKGMQFSYKIVKKCSSLIEAQLALELLNLYHIKAQMVQNYQDAEAKMKDTVEGICLLVLPQDYQLAQQLLLAG